MKKKQEIEGVSFCAKFAIFLLILLGIGVVLLIASIHQVPEGHVGVYWFGGAIENQITSPGFHLKYPLLHQ